MCKSVASLILTIIIGKGKELNAAANGYTPASNDQTNFLIIFQTDN